MAPNQFENLCLQVRVTSSHSIFLRDKKGVGLKMARHLRGRVLPGDALKNSNGACGVCPIYSNHLKKPKVRKDFVPVEVLLQACICHVKNNKSEITFCSKRWKILLEVIDLFQTFPVVINAKSHLKELWFVYL